MISKERELSCREGGRSEGGAAAAAAWAGWLQALALVPVAPAIAGQAIAHPRAWRPQQWQACGRQGRRRAAPAGALCMAARCAAWPGPGGLGQLLCTAGRPATAPCARLGWASAGCYAWLLPRRPPTSGAWAWAGLMLPPAQPPMHSEGGEEQRRGAESVGEVPPAGGLGSRDGGPGLGLPSVKLSAVTPSLACVATLGHGMNPVHFLIPCAPTCPPGQVGIRHPGVYVFGAYAKWVRR